MYPLSSDSIYINLSLLFYLLERILEFCWPHILLKWCIPFLRRIPSFQIYLISIHLCSFPVWSLSYNLAVNDVSSISRLFIFTKHQSVFAFLLSGWRVTCNFASLCVFKKRCIPCLWRIPALEIHNISIRICSFTVWNVSWNLAGNGVLTTKFIPFCWPWCVEISLVSVVSPLFRFTMYQSVFAVLLSGAYLWILLGMIFEKNVYPLSLAYPLS